MAPVRERKTNSEPHDRRELEDAGLYAVLAAGLVAGPPALIAALAAQPLIARRRLESLGPSTRTTSREPRRPSSSSGRSEIPIEIPI